MILVFDIETIPDIEAGKKIYQLEGLSDNDVVLAMQALRRQKTGHDFLPHYLQKIIAISVVFEQNDALKIWSLGDLSATESELISRFFAGLEKHHPTLVSWNGNGFDLPVLHYRSLLHGIPSAIYWETGDHISDFRWNNYLNRYHYRHVDLMDTLSAYQSKAFAPLDDLSVLLGLPGKWNIDGSQVFHEYQQGNLENIRAYCEIDVLNTYLIYLRFEYIRTKLSQEEYQLKLSRTRSYLKCSEKKHFIEFEQAM